MTWNLASFFGTQCIIYVTVMYLQVHSCERHNEAEQIFQAQTTHRQSESTRETKHKSRKAITVTHWSQSSCLYVVACTIIFLYKLLPLSASSLSLNVSLSTYSSLYGITFIQIHAQTNVQMAFSPSIICDCSHLPPPSLHFKWSVSSFSNALSNAVFIINNQHHLLWH